MKCPSCAAAELAHGNRDMPYTYSGETIILPKVVGGYCPVCGEMVLDAMEATRVSAAMLDFNKQVSANQKH
jgi:HTH-type transcriptional regulator / antitoxin MqsA